MPKTRTEMTPPPVKTMWSTIDVTKFGPLKEARMARLARMIWTEGSFKKEFLAQPKEVLAQEASLILPAQTRVIVVEEGSGGTAHFAVPATPPKSEILYRFEQIANWWMLAHGFFFWMSRMEHGEKAGALLEGVQVAFIARMWTDPKFRADLLADPKPVLEKETSMSFPGVKSYEDTSDRIHMVLPLAPKDQDLDASFQSMGSWFMTAHTWWYWLLFPRLLSPAEPVVTDWVG
jgi:hypothetical protein